MVALNRTERIFKTAWFSRSARKARIPTSDLCDAIGEVILGQADDLGGGVFKKRLNRNMHRGIILARGRRHWFYVYLFAKNDRSNIEQDELEAFRKLSRSYEDLSEQQLSQLVATGELTEICHD